MAGEKSDDIELDDGFADDTAPADAEPDVVSDAAAKAALIKNALLKRRELDDLIEARNLQRSIREYDYGNARDDD